MFNGTCEWNWHDTLLSSMKKKCALPIFFTDIRLVHTALNSFNDEKAECVIVIVTPDCKLSSSAKCKYNHS